MDAIREGYHLLLEKPPCLTTDECDLLIETAHELDVTIFASWHSKFGAMVKNAAEWLQKMGVTTLKSIGKKIGRNGILGRSGFQGRVVLESWTQA